MTIDEAIAHAKEKAEKNRKAEAMFLRDDLIWNAKQEHKLAEEHEQLAEWLEELKIFKECNISKINFENGYNKAIDDFAEKLHDLCGFEIDDIQYPYLLHESRIDEIAEQLKAGGIDG